MRAVVYARVFFFGCNYSQNYSLLQLKYKIYDKNADTLSDGCVQKELRIGLISLLIFTVKFIAHFIGSGFVVIAIDFASVLLHRITSNGLAADRFFFVLHGNMDAFLNPAASFSR